MVEISSVVAKSPDGTVQINFTIPFSLVQKTKDEVVETLAAGIEIPGFRKGKAPLAKAREKIPENSIIERTLSKLLPSALGQAIEKHKIKIAIYPKFELLKAKENEDWEVRALTCELPDFELGDYKKVIEGAFRSSKLWIPDKGAKEEGIVSTEQKREIVIKAVLENIKVIIPQILIDEEANSRLSALLSRIEKLGLSLENYLASIGKTSGSLRADYQKQARETIALELILNKIAEAQNTKVDQKEIEAAVKIFDTSTEPSQKLNPEDKKRIVENILRRRAVLDSLTLLL